LESLGQFAADLRRQQHHGGTRKHFDNHLDSAIIERGGSIQTQAEFRVHGMDCAEEVLLIRRRLDREPGVSDLAFDLLHGKMRVDFDSHRIDAPAIQRAVSETGLKVEPWRDLVQSDIPLWHRHGRVLLAGLSGACLVAAMAWQAVTTGDIVGSVLAHEHAGHHASPVVVALCLVAIAAGAYFVLPKALASFRRMQPDMNALVVISLVGAVYLSEWLEGATLSFLFALAALLESFSLARARRAVEALIEVTPGEATVVHHDHEHRMPVSQVRAGAVVRVRPGERIPCDGEVESGGSDVNQSMITGESVPVWKSRGDAVYAGTMNGDGAIELRATKPGSDSTLARMIRIVEGVQHRRSPSEQWVEKFSRYYTPAMILLAALVAVVPPLAGGGAWGDWFYKSMVVLLISCPCALVISTPVSVVAALASAARQGVLIKGGAYLEEAARLHTAAFDKTGVLTRGEPRVTRLVALDGLAESDVLARLAALESHSPHPVARAIVRYAKEQGVAIDKGAGQFLSLHGRGAEASIAGERFWAGSLRFMEEKGIRAQLPPGLEGTVMACGTDQRAWAVVQLEDPVRAEAAEAIRGIRAAGIQHVVMLTGDNRAVADRVGGQVGVDEVRSELLPQDKAATVDDIKARHGKVAMVGDGVNDAQAMARANLGIALGGQGLDVVMETADVVLMSGDLQKLPFLLSHARRALRVIQQNVAIALALKVVVGALAYFGVATLWMAVLGDMGATLLVTFNGLRLLRPGGRA
jgi:Cd2+/Zn2+-exporting ATPase